jgi:single-strand DNA-binding protein
MFNKITIVGRAGRDAETRTLPNGTAVANLTIATTESWKDASGQKQEKTDWHNVQFWRGLAEVVGKYAKKGGLYLVEGRMTYRKYTDKDGIERTVAEIVADEFKMLDKPSGAGNAPAQQSSAPAANAVADDDNDLPF